jgi:hypothetical protein
LNLQIAKWDIFNKKSNLSDFIAYYYENRNLNINDVKNKFENHQIKYGLNLKKNIGLGIGLDYLSRNYNKIGSHFYASKWFSKPKISTTLATSIFKNQINYKTEIFKDISFYSRFLVDRISFGIGYEDFMRYRDLYFKFRILI